MRKLDHINVAGRPKVLLPHPQRTVIFSFSAVYDGSFLAERLLVRRSLLGQSILSEAVEEKEDPE